VRKVTTDASGLLLILIALLLLAGILFTVFTFRQDPMEESLTGDRVINTLFIIENGDAVGVKPLCSYVLMYCPATKRAAVFDIPGSLGQIIQSVNRVDRIDTVYHPGRIAPFEQELEKLLGIDIAFYVVLSLENLGKVTDLLEGVEVFIPTPVDERQDGCILFPSGVNRLDGDKARVYISYELPEENYELVNSRRQHFFMRFIKRLGEQNQFLKNPQAARINNSLFRTGINKSSLARLFDEFAGIDTDRLNIQTVSGNVREISGQRLIFPHFDGSLIKEIVRQTLGGMAQPADSGPGDRSFTVEILNGTTVSGLAGRTAELFRGFGYDIISVDNADRNDYDKTIIIDRSGFQDRVIPFGELIRCKNIRFETPGFIETEIDLISEDYVRRADFTLIIGKDFNGRYVAE
jgi:anionic cell wall polymer biosynthesis LytR-Cps2A-Psr (LCP) family protein